MEIVAGLDACYCGDNGSDDGGGGGGDRHDSRLSGVLPAAAVTSRWPSLATRDRVYGRPRKRRSAMPMLNIGVSTTPRRRSASARLQPVSSMTTKLCAANATSREQHPDRHSGQPPQDGSQTSTTRWSFVRKALSQNNTLLRLHARARTLKASAARERTAAASGAEARPLSRRSPSLPDHLPSLHWAPHARRSLTVNCPAQSATGRCRPLLRWRTTGKGVLTG
jgi:hypothetical protein